MLLLFRAGQRALILLPSSLQKSLVWIMKFIKPTGRGTEGYGFDQDVILALKYLTHDKSVEYFDYVKKIKENPIAMQVKLADLKHNSDLTRYDELEDWMVKRNEKYIKAIDLLLS